MKPRLLHASKLYLGNTLILVITILTIPPSYGVQDDQFTNCSTLYNCGTMKEIGYPFWGGDRPEFCGRPDLGLLCDGDKYSILVTSDRLFPKYNQTIRVLNIEPFNANHTMTLVSKDVRGNICAETFINPRPTLNYSINNYAQNVEKLRIFYGCSSEALAEVKVAANITCRVSGTEAEGVLFAEHWVSSMEGCSMSVVVPVFRTAYNELWEGRLTLVEAVYQGYDVDYASYDFVACSACQTSGGRCGSDSTLQFVCFCPDKPRPDVCPMTNRKHGINRRVKLTIGASVSGMVILFGTIIICYWRCKKSEKSVLFWLKKTKTDRNLEAFIKHVALKRYNYSDIKKMTNSFRDKLGEGGYGVVYKGSLPDGPTVAVKVLNESKGNGEEFINEVASISRTSHVNVVTILGFCLEGRKRALIYDFMPNGSLEKFIYGKNPTKTGGELGWQKLYQITIGIARGLEYLHRGCNTRILHFDIKPHNILLDTDFCPKISDFGLAKLCSRKESIVSMLEARGTIGYIAPEVFSRNFGGVSNKSDVYSYGMMVLEMVGGRKNVDVGVSHTSKVYFPHWAYRRLELDEDFELQDIVAMEEYEIARKMILVGMWCIQTDPSQRPSMNKVIDMLEGSVESLKIPPKPFLYSPSRSASNSFSTAAEH